MEKFVAPEPLGLETHTQYIMRVVQAFEEWVNRNYPPQKEADHS